MRIGEVIGKLTLSKCDPQFVGGSYLIVQPHDPKSLRESGLGRGEVEVVYDGVGANPGDRVGFSEGAEAAQPFQPRKVAIDAYLACILDTVTYDVT